MARVALVSELGVGHDHLRRLAWIARGLQARGHEPLFVVNDTVKADAVMGDQAWPVLQAPAWRSPVAGLPPARTYTDLLLRHGFVDAAGLRGLVRAWRHLLALLRPQLLLFDHAPVALYATRAAGLPRLRCGDGFGTPPLATPMPQFAWWAPQEDPFDQIGERGVLHAANLAAAELGDSGVVSVAGFLAADGDLLCTVPELDAYGRSPGQATWLGPLVPAAPTSGPALPWPAGDGPLAYVQLRGDYAPLPALLQALQHGGWRAVVHAPGLSSTRVKALAGARVQFAPEPPPVADVAERCALAISHGGYGSVHALAQAGRPQLLLPLQTSQHMLAHRIERAGAGLLIDSAAADPDFAPALQRLHDPAALAEGAAALAERLSGQGGDAAVDLLMQRCEALL